MIQKFVHLLWTKWLVLIILVCWFNPRFITNRSIRCASINKRRQSIDHLLTFLKTKSHTIKEIAKQVLQYLHHFFKLNILKCQNQSYNTANMSMHCRRCNKNFLWKICTMWNSFNLEGQNIVDCCQMAAKFFSKYRWQASESQSEILKVSLGKECIKIPYWFQMGGTHYDNSGIS